MNTPAPSTVTPELFLVIDKKSRRRVYFDEIAQWWVVLVVGTLLVSASVMNSFALMRVNANMAVLRQELRAMQTMQQAQQESGQQSQHQP